MKTYATKKSDIVTGWKLFDATDVVLGRLATKIAKILMGKDKPYYAKTQVCGDKVLVINAARLKFTGNKLEDKIYYKHSGYLGGLKEEALGSLQQRRPSEPLRLAVLGMLPRNKLAKKIIANLYIYPGEEHPHRPQIGDLAKEKLV